MHQVLRLARRPEPKKDSFCITQLEARAMRREGIRQFTSCVLCAAIAVLAIGERAGAGTIWYVDNDNCPGRGSGTDADPFCQIVDGIDAATHADTVLVAPGIYHEPSTIDFAGKA